MSFAIERANEIFHRQLNLSAYFDSPGVNGSVIQDRQIFNRTHFECHLITFSRARGTRGAYARVYAYIKRAFAIPSRFRHPREFRIAHTVIDIDEIVDTRERAKVHSVTKNTRERRIHGGGIFGFYIASINARE